MIFQAPPGGAPDSGNPGGNRPDAWRRAQGVSRTGECHMNTLGQGRAAPLHPEGDKLLTRCAPRAPADARLFKRKENEMSIKKKETIADIVAAMRNEGHAGDESCLEWVGAKIRGYADRIEAAANREREAVSEAAGESEVTK